MQLLYFLGKGSSALSFDARKKLMLRGMRARCEYLSRGCPEHAARIEPTPYVVYVQRLARLMRQRQAATGVLPTTDLVPLYLASEKAEGVHDEATTAMLEQLYRMRQLTLLIDGVDEAADLKEIVEDHVTRELAPAGHPVVVTSRPEGVRLRLFSSFVILNLRALSEEQQGRAINMQLSDSTFYAHLRDFSKIRSTLDEIYTTQAFPLAVLSRLLSLPPSMPILPAHTATSPHTATPSSHVHVHTRTTRALCAAVAAPSVPCAPLTSRPIATSSSVPSTPTSSRSPRAAASTRASARAASTTTGASWAGATARHARPSCAR
jgi:hypothetical protein